MTAPAGGAPAARICFIDVAKGLGILLVFYGHLIECFYHAGREGAVEQMRWIYCFHMPLFFFLSGLVYKERALPAEAFLKRQTLTRLIPAWSFNFLSMVMLTFVAFLTAPAGPGKGFGTLLKTKTVRFGWETLCGRPFFNVLMWFLICLFVVELIQFALRKPLRRTAWLLVSMAFFAGLTFVFARYHTLIADIWGSLPFDAGLLKIEFWQFSSAVSAIVFYQAGILFRRHNALAVASRPLMLAIGGAAGLLITLLTFNCNDAHPVVFVAHGGYGNAGWFFLSAFAGIAFMVGLSGLLSFSRLLRKLGQVTLGLMCLDGVLHGLVNVPLARRVAPLLPEHSIPVLTLSCIALTLLSVLVCLPFVWLLERYAPILLGRVVSPRAVSTSSEPLIEATRPPQ